MTVVLYSTEPQYAEHLWPLYWYNSVGHPDWVWAHLPDRVDDRLRDCAVVVAGFNDLVRARKAKARQVVLMQHGAGQSYSSQNSSYPGGNGHHHAALVLMPNEQAAARHRKRYGDRVPVEVVGCPKLDPWVARPTKVRTDPPTVVISFHWRCNAAREAGTMWDEWGRDAIAALWDMDQRGKITLLVHAHPRIAEEVRDALVGLVPVGRFVEKFASVMTLADLYVCDNSSTIFEFAALDRPVVLMSSARWRRNVEHGGRFWRWAHVGPEAITPERLQAGVSMSLGGDLHAKARRGVVAEVFPHLGSASERAVAAINAVEASK